MNNTRTILLTFSATGNILRRTDLMYRLPTKIWHWLCLCLCVSFGLTVQASNTAPAHSVRLAWDASADPEVTGYRVYYGNAPTNYTQILDVGNLARATVSNLTAGVKYYFAVTAYTASGLESDPADEISHTISTASTAGGAGASGTGQRAAASSAPPEGTGLVTLLSHATSTASDAGVVGAGGTGHGTTESSASLEGVGLATSPSPISLLVVGGTGGAAIHVYAADLPGADWALQVSVDLSNWHTVGVGKAGQAINYASSELAEGQRGFYRVVMGRAP